MIRPIVSAPNGWPKKYSICKAATFVSIAVCGRRTGCAANRYCRLRKSHETNSLRRISGHFCVSTGRDLLMLTPLFTGISRQIRARMPPAAGRRSGRIIAISTNCLNPGSCAYIFRSDVPPDAVGINSSMLVLAMALPLFITVSLLRRRRSDHPYLSSCPVSFFLCLSGLDTGSPFAGVGASRELTSAFWSNPCSFSHCWYWR